MKISKRDKWWPGYKRFAATKAATPPVVAWMSTEMQDPAYDNVIASFSDGQYQQTSLWARTKSAGKWSPLRVVFTQKKQVVASFQILEKGWSIPGRIGYISKGPIINTSDGSALEFILYQLKKITRNRSIRALMVQPPDRAGDVEEMLRYSGLIQNRAGGIVSATLIMDLTPEIDAIQKSMTPKKRQAIRQGQKAGLTVREGSEADLDTFYAFMCETCRRQRVIPAPDPKTLLSLWRQMAPAGLLRMFVIEHEGKPISATLVIAFGQTITLWKTGWNGEHAHSHPNDLLCWEIIRWAKSEGYKYADFYGIDAKTADAILDGKPDADITASVSYFKVAFGGQIQRLPSSLVYISNPLLRMAYNYLYPILRQMSRRALFFLRDLRKHREITVLQPNKEYSGT